MVVVFFDGNDDSVFNEPPGSSELVDELHHQEISRNSGGSSD
jgi:hypothetical protein